MATEPIFGIVPRRVDTEAMPAIYADLDTVGIIGPAEHADAAIFPLNMPVKFNSDNTSMIASLGSDTLIVDAIRGVADQLADFEHAAQIVVVRTAAGTDNNPAVKLQETLAAIMGDPTAGTGVYAFLKSAEEVHAVPRLIMAPGYTGQLYNGLDTLTTTNAGSGYIQGESYPITFTGGGTGVVQGNAHAVAKADGTLDTPVIDSFGAFYQSAPTPVVAAPATGTQAVFAATIALNSDPVCAALPPVLSGLIAHAVVDSTGIKVVDPTTGATLEMPTAPRVIGTMIRRDFQTGAPFHSAANQPIFGIIGPGSSGSQAADEAWRQTINSDRIIAVTGRKVNFNITDGANEGQQLLEQNIGIVARGELGNDFAIAQGGFIFIGTDNTGEDELWRFYNVTRGRDFINLTLIRALRYYLGRFNITGQTVQVVINEMRQVLSYLKARDNLIGYKIGFSGSLNSTDEIRKGNITISFAAEEPSVLRKITSQGSRYRPAVDALIAQLEAQLVVTG